jgi:hypothetical protein
LLQVEHLPATWAVKSIALDGTEITDVVTELAPAIVLARCASSSRRGPRACAAAWRITTARAGRRACRDLFE